LRVWQQAVELAVRVYKGSHCSDRDFRRFLSSRERFAAGVGEADSPGGQATI